MKKLAAILGMMLISSTVFGASPECTKMLGRLILHTQEGARLNAAAIHHGFNIETGEVDQVNEDSKFADKYLELSIKHLHKAEALENQLVQECLK